MRPVVLLLYRSAATVMVDCGSW